MGQCPRTTSETAVVQHGANKRSVNVFETGFFCQKLVVKYKNVCLFNFIFKRKIFH